MPSAATDTGEPRLPDDLPRLARRARESGKHDYGRVLVVGGAAGMAGAPALAAMAALRSGAGLVHLAAPESAARIAATFDPCVMAHALPERADGTFAHDAHDAIVALADRADALGVGPGIGRSESAGAIVRGLWRGFPGPAVFDADALWWLARLDPATLATHAGPRLLTPHAGEMRRFLGDGLAAGAAPSRTTLEAAADALAAECELVVLLKGPDTLVTDGRRRWHNVTGNPGMATGGCGDVLTGMVVGLLCQPAVGGRLAVHDAARLAAWVHGRAGDLAAATLGELSLTARDLLDALPQAYRPVVAPA